VCELIIRLVGFREEQLCGALRELFLNTDGTSWRSKQGWMAAAKLLNAGKGRGGIAGVARGASGKQKGGDGRGGGREVAQKQRFSLALSDMFGVMFDAARSEVTKLSLINNNLRGALSPNVGYLCGLTQLSLSENALSGWIPESLGGLVLLEVRVVSKFCD
jgi:hypothetical protein